MAGHTLPARSGSVASVSAGADAPPAPFALTLAGDAREGAGAERRRSPRLDVDRACKVYRPAVQRYEPAQTTNVSVGGCLIELRSARPVSAGERLSLGVAWTGQPVVRARSLLEAEVVRVSSAGDGVQTVALRFCGGRAAVAAA